MSNINVYTEVKITVTETEKETLTKAYEILKELQEEIWNEDLEDTEEGVQVWYVKDNLYRLLHSHLRIDIEE